jgi:hypothetical protein
MTDVRKLAAEGRFDALLIESGRHLRTDAGCRHLRVPQRERHLAR